MGGVDGDDNDKPETPGKGWGLCVVEWLSVCVCVWLCVFVCLCVCAVTD